MVPNSKGINVEKGEFLEFACVEGKARVGLERAISEYSIEGNYRIDFRPIAEDSEKAFTVGIYENPTIGSLSVTYFLRDQNYIISGESYGEGIVDIIQDFLDIIQLEPRILETNNNLVRKMKKALKEQEQLLRVAHDEDLRKQFYLKILSLSQNVRYARIPK